MDFWTVLKACARRWYVFLPILGLALVVGNIRVSDAPPVYLATSSAALTGPSLIPGGQPGEIVEVNPFQSLGGSMETTTEIAVSLMDSEPKRDQFAQEGVTGDYTVSNDKAVIYFDVTGPDPTAVTQDAAQLIQILDTEVAGLQSKPVENPESRIRAVPLAVPQVADKDTVAGLRMLAVIGTLGLALATAGAVAVDGAITARRRSRARRAAAPTVDRATPARDEAPGRDGAVHRAPARSAHEVTDVDPDDTRARTDEPVAVAGTRQSRRD